MHVVITMTHNERDGVSNHQPHDCLLNLLFGRRSKKTSKLRVTGPPPAGNSPVTGEFSQRISKAENVSIWWRHHGKCRISWCIFQDCPNVMGRDQKFSYADDKPVGLCLNESETKWPSFCRGYFQMHFLEWKYMNLIDISLKFAPKCHISNVAVLVQIMAWRRPICLTIISTASSWQRALCPG